MKKTFRKAAITLVFILICSINSCVKDDAKTPFASTGEVTFVNTGAVTVSGIINSNGSPTRVYFEYGTTTSYGNSVRDPLCPYLQKSNVNVTADIEGLIAFTTYHFRIKAENDIGNSYGNDKTFKVECMVCKMVTRQNGNILNEGSELSYCGADLQLKLNTPPVVVLGVTTKWECR